MDWTWFLVAAAAPIVLWLLWRIQALAVDKVLRTGMYRLLRHQRATYNVVSWMGVLLHEISHAFFLILGGHGIQDFKVGVDAGHVTPKQVRKSTLGTLTFMVAALAPMFVAPAAILVLLILLPSGDWPPALVSGPGIAVLLANLQNTAFGVGLLAVSELWALDVATWGGGVLLALMVFALPSARPSHVKKKGGDEGDIAVVRRTIRRRPLAFIILVVLAYASYFALIPWAPEVYWRMWQVAWMVAIIGIVFPIGMGIVWHIVAWTGRIRGWAMWLPYAAVVAVQVFGRLSGLDLVIMNVITLAAFFFLAYGLYWVARRPY